VLLAFLCANDKIGIHILEIPQEHTHEHLNTLRMFAEQMQRLLEVDWKLMKFSMKFLDEEGLTIVTDI